MSERYSVERCPHCGSHRVQSELTHNPLTLDQEYRVRCHACGLVVFGFETEKEAIEYWNDQALKLKDEAEKKDNPYTEFAKEMSLLHEALKAEGFKDAMVDILAKMTPIVWDKVELKRARELHNVRRAARRYGRAVEEKSDETFAESFVREVNADNLLRNQESMDAIVKKGLGL